MRSRLQRQQDKKSLKLALKYLILAVGLLFILGRFGLPALIQMAGFLSNLNPRPEASNSSQAVLLAPRLNYLPEATSSSQINLSGWAQAESIVRLYVRGVNIQETRADKDNLFEFKDIHLADGDNEIYAEIIDAKANISPASDSLNILVDTKKPELTLIEPKDGQQFFDRDSPITLSGKTEANINLTLNNRFVLVQSDGSFTLQHNLSQGENPLELIARDSANNETKLTLTVSYTP